MSDLQPRVWDAQLKSWNVDIEVAKKMFPYVNIFSDSLPYRTSSTHYIDVVNRLMDMEEQLGIERNDWIYGGGCFFFTTEEQAILFKLAVIS